MVVNKIFLLSEDEIRLHGKKLQNATKSVIIIDPSMKVYKQTDNLLLNRIKKRSLCISPRFFALLSSSLSGQGKRES